MHEACRFSGRLGSANAWVWTVKGGVSFQSEGNASCDLQCASLADSQGSERARRPGGVASLLRAPRSLVARVRGPARLMLSGADIESAWSEGLVNPAYMVVAIVACAFVGYGAYLALSGVAGPRVTSRPGELSDPVQPTVQPTRGRNGSMHQIEVVLQPDCLGSVSEALRKAKIGPFRASDVTVFDPAAAPEGSYRGARYAIGRERVKVELVLPDHEVEPAVEAIRDGIDAFGEGYAELVVLPVHECVHLGPSPWTRRRSTS